MNDVAELLVKAPEDTVPTPFPFSAEDIRKSSTLSVVHHVVEGLDEGQQFSLDIVKSIFAKEAAIAARRHEGDNLSQERDNSSFDEHLVRTETLPPIARYSLPDKKSDEGNPIIAGTSKVFPEGIKNFGDYNALLAVGFKAAELLEPNARAEFTRYILSYVDKYSDSWELANSLMKFAQKSSNSKVLFQVITDDVVKNKEALINGLKERLSLVDSPKGEIIWNYGFKYQRELLDTLMKYDIKTTTEILGMLSVDFRLQDIISMLRKAYGNATVPAEREKLEQMGRIVTGHDPNDKTKPFYESLEKLYANIQFEKYPVNEAINNQEVNFIDELLQDITLSQGNILDLACGTGRIANALAKRGYKNIVGLDSSDRNVETARETDETKLVDYRVADWKKTGLPNQSVAFTSIVGRSFCHGSPTDFAAIVDELDRILQPGGKALFDFPDPNKGSYLENRNKYMSIVSNLQQAIGINNPHTSYNNDEYVVDSPNGTDFYDRWVPQFGKVEEIIRRKGLKVTILKSEPIPNGGNNENVYFLLEKDALGTKEESVLARRWFKNRN